MNVTCSAEPCPVILNATCVFYEGETLLYTGITTNDNLQTALQKIDAKFADAAIGYAFNNGLIQSAPGQPVQLGGSLIQNTTIGGNYRLAFVGELEASALVTTGGTSSQFVKGDGTLDSTSYQPAGNYITNLTGDVLASGPGSVPATLATVFGAPGTYGNSGTIPSITVDGKGRVTNVTPVAVNYPAQSLSFVGDVDGFGFTGSPVTLTLDTVNTDVYGSNNFLKFAVNGKGLITSATPVSNGDITTALGYVPVDDAIELTINGVSHDLSANRSWSVGTVTNVSITAGTGINASISNPNTTPSISITNTAPDQTVVLNGGTGISVTGSYPNFTIINDYPSLGGTVTNFSAGNLSPLFTTSVSNSSTTPALSFALSNAAANTVFAGPNGGSGAPTFRALVAADIPSLSYISSISVTSPLASTGGLTPTLSISQADSSTNGYLSSVDWNTFNAKQPAGNYITALTGDATASGPGSACLTFNTVNATTGTFGSSTQVPVITVNGKGLVTCVTTSNISGSLEFIGDVTGTGSTGACTTLTLATVNNDVYASETLLNIAVNGKGLITSANPTTAGDICSTLGYTPENVANKSTCTSLGTSNTLYPTQLAVKTYVDSATSGGIILQGDWNAATNTPDITGTTTTGWAWRVSVSGTTNLGGITDWHVGDLAVKSATGWVKIDNSDGVTSVFGRFGAVVATTGDYLSCQVTECGNLYYTDTRVRAAVGHTAPLTYNSTTGVFGISQSNCTTDGYLSATDWTTFNDKQPALGYTPVNQTRQLTINGTTYDLTADRSWSVGTVTSVTGSAPLASSGGTAPNLTISQSGTASDGYLSSTDWNHFNSHTSCTGTVTNVATCTSTTGVLLSGSPVTTSGTLGVDISTASSVCTGLLTAADWNTFNSHTGCTGTVTSVGLTSATTGVTIGSSPITSSGNITLAIATASATCTGLLTAADWNTFNSHTGCTGTVTCVNATGTNISVTGGPITSSGTLNISLSGANVCSALGYTPYDSSNPNGYTTCTGTVTSVGIVATNINVCCSPVTTSGNICLNLTGANVCAALGYSPSTAPTIFVNGIGTCSVLRCGVSNGASGDYTASLGGQSNLVSGCYSTIVGGQCNNISERRAVIVGGLCNTVSSYGGAVFTGVCNTSSGISASVVVGGSFNTASGYLSIVGGGNRNSATATYSSVFSGCCNTTCGCNSFIGGGYCNIVSGNYSSISSGFQNTASETSSTVSGGLGNTASGYVSFVGGGSFNTASGGTFQIGGSFVGGGNNNTASGVYSAIVGGGSNTTSGENSFVGGGHSNTACGCYSAALSGCCNNAIGNFSFIGGGECNTVSSDYGSLISGGFCNTICAGAVVSTISNGYNNIINAPQGFIGGGGNNTIASGFRSFIGTGNCNTVCGSGSTIVNGDNNLITGGFGSSIGFGSFNINCDSYLSTIVSGSSNCIINGNFATIINGDVNTIDGVSCEQFIGGGFNNKICNTRGSFIGTGFCNTICSGYAFSPSYPVIVGGVGNSISSASNSIDGSSIVGGVNNNILGTTYGACASFIGGGGYNKICDVGNSSIVGGSDNTISCNGAASFIGGGINNNIRYNVSFIGGGVNNTASEYLTTITGGGQNSIYSPFSFIGSGYLNSISGAYASSPICAIGSTIGGGWGNTIHPFSSTSSAIYSTIAGGKYNVVASDYSSIGGGECNTICENSPSSAIVGGFCNCTGVGGLNFIGSGSHNYAANAYSIVVGGWCNYNNGAYSFIGGGTDNGIGGWWSSVTGGRCNLITAGGDGMAIVGGLCNRIFGGGYATSILGGIANCTSSGYSSIVGGVGNKICFGPYATILGGCCNTASGYSSSVLGGVNNVTNANYSAVFGCGLTNNNACTFMANNFVIGDFVGCGGCSLALDANGKMCIGTGGGGGGIMILGTGCNSTIRCGVNNVASGCYSASLSGQCNTACGNFSTISGGQCNIAFSLGTVIAGGEKNCGGGNIFPTVSGGYCNYADNVAVVAGGARNNACGSHAVIGGGFYNTASGYCSTVSGGFNNTISGGYYVSRSTIGGGYCNTICAPDSFIGGGIFNTIHNNPVYQQYGGSTIAGGQSNFVGTSRSNIAGGWMNTIACEDGLPTGNAIGGGFNNKICCTCSGSYNTISGGAFNTIANNAGDSETISSSLISGGYDNVIRDSNSTIAGGQSNTICKFGYNSFIGSGVNNKICSSYSFIGGGSSNTICCGAQFLTISGGQCNTVAGIGSSVVGGVSNTISGGYSGTSCCNSSFIGGGQGNQVFSEVSSVVGGLANAISGGCLSVIAGGQGNYINNSCRIFIGGGLAHYVSNSLNSSIGGGSYNSIFGNYSFVGGGSSNSVSGCYSAVLGGYGNSVSGNYSGAFGSGLTNANDYSFMANRLFADNLASFVGFGVEIGAGGELIPSFSDGRLKTNICNIEYGLGDVKKLNPVSFNWNEETSKTRGCRKQLGFIAQEVRLIIPEAVGESNDENTALSLNPNQIIPILTKAIQELAEKNISLEDRISKLEQLILNK